MVEQGKTKVRTQKMPTWQKQRLSGDCPSNLFNRGKATKNPPVQNSKTKTILENQQTKNPTEKTKTRPQYSLKSRGNKETTQTGNDPTKTKETHRLK